MKPVIQKIAEDISTKGCKQVQQALERYRERNERDKVDIQEKLEDEMLKVTEHLKKYIMKTQQDLSDAIRNLHKIIGRDKADQKIVNEKHFDMIQANRGEIERHKMYFDTLAQSIAILAENTNMQMEAEYADLFDRKMMALYGALPQKGSKVDFTTKLSSKVRQKPYRVEASRMAAAGHELDQQEGVLQT